MERFLTPILLLVLIGLAVYAWFAIPSAQAMPLSPGYDLRLAVHDNWVDAVVIMPQAATPDELLAYRRAVFGRLFELRRNVKWTECVDDGMPINDCTFTVWIKVESIQATGQNTLTRGMQ